jgi:hypothetical protein
MLGFVLALFLRTQAAHPSTASSPETRTERTQLVEQGIEWSPDRIAVIEYVRKDNQVIIDYTCLRVAEAEYRRLAAKKELDEQEQRRFAALVIALGTFATS